MGREGDYGKIEGSLGQGQSLTVDLKDTDKWIRRVTEVGNQQSSRCTLSDLCGIAGCTCRAQL